MVIYYLRKDVKQKVEEDLYVIDQNLGDSNYLLSQIKKHNSWSTYLTLLRSLNYASYSKYASVFQFEDTSDSIFIILKGNSPSIHTSMNMDYVFMEENNPRYCLMQLFSNSFF